MRSLTNATLCVALAVISACSSAAATGSAIPGGAAPEFSSPIDQTFGSGAIQHIVVIVQENRTVDNLFNGFPGADTQLFGKNEGGQVVVLHPTPLAAPFDISHTHNAWLKDYNNGKMNGFDTESENCYAGQRHERRCPPQALASYGYIARSEVEPYWDMALQYTFADKMFQSNQGPSFPAHQYLISGTSTISDGSQFRAENNASAPHAGGGQGGCNSTPSATVVTIDERGKPGPSVYPCFDRDSIMHEMDESHVTWRYFQERGGSGQWHAVDAIRNVWDGPTFSNVKYPSRLVLKMVRDRQLPQVTFVTPSAKNSDHAGRTNGDGPSWVASIVNQIGESPDWQSTAIVVVWDDWGGWYDHVRPKVYNSYELSFRVPMLVISPYAKQGYVSHVHYEFGSVLKFIEETFGVKSLGTTDVRANDLSDCFDFTKPLRKFQPIKAKVGAQFFEREAVDDTPVDDDD